MGLLHQPKIGLNVASVQRLSSISFILVCMTVVRQFTPAHSSTSSVSSPSSSTVSSSSSQNPSPISSDSSTSSDDYPPSPSYSSTYSGDSSSPSGYSPSSYSYSSTSRPYSSSSSAYSSASSDDSSSSHYSSTSSDNSSFSSDDSSTFTASSITPADNSSTSFAYSSPSSHDSFPSSSPSSSHSSSTPSDISSSSSRFWSSSSYWPSSYGSSSNSSTSSWYSWYDDEYFDDNEYSNDHEFYDDHGYSEDDGYFYNDDYSDDHGFSDDHGYSDDDYPDDDWRTYYYPSTQSQLSTYYDDYFWNPGYSSTWYEYYEDLIAMYPNCTGYLDWIGDDICDYDTNNPSCDYDGGDCCDCQCYVDDYSDCVFGGIDCIDPSAVNETCVPYDDDDYDGDSFYNDDSSYYVSSSYYSDDWYAALFETFPNCTGVIEWISDGYCDDWDNNSPSCGYDGGDCCFCTCNSTELYTCGVVGYQCMDPNGLTTADCTPPQDYEDYAYDYYQNYEHWCNNWRDASSDSLTDDSYASEVCRGYDENRDARGQQYPDCAGLVGFIGDGRCDRRNNVESCGFDDGDCCPCTCDSSRHSNCGEGGYNCTDPSATSLENLCDPPLGEIEPCSSYLPSEWEVKNSSDASHLAQAIFCSGGTFDVMWNGDVILMEHIYVVNGTTLHVRGTGSSAVANGGNLNRMFTVINATLHVSDLRFVDGSATIGGAIAAEQATLTFERTEFQSNAGTYGGALFVRDESTVFFSQQTTFSENTANLAGGALFVTDVPSISWSGRTTFMNNVANNSGGVMHIRNTVDLSWTGSTTFEANRAGYGGALTLWDVGNVEFSGQTTFEKNTANDGSAGAIFVGSGCTVTIAGATTFIANSAKTNGGALASSETESGGNSPEVILDGTVSFENNSCAGNGGAIEILGGLSVLFEGLSLNFTSNSAETNGGAVYVAGTEVGPRFRALIFTENKADGDGGGVYVAASGISRTSDSPYSNPTIFRECTFLKNEAQGAGGAIYSASGSDAVMRSSFVGNTAGSGGALKFSSQRARVSDCSFIENSSDEQMGPAISNEGISLEVIECTFEGNFFKCPPGEFVDIDETTGASRYSEDCANCPPCSNCDVANETTVPICTPALEHTTSPGGSVNLQNLVLDKGFWRVTSLSRKALACYREEACLGGITDSTDFCDGRFTGPYCAVCSEGFVSRVQYACDSCAGEDGATAVIVILAILLSIFLLVLLWFLLSANATVEQNGIISRVTKNLPIQSLKIVIVVWQILTQFASAANVTFPSVYQTFLNMVTVLNFELDWIFAATCVLDVNFHYRFLMITIGPFVALGLLGVTYCISSFLNRRSPDAIEFIREKHFSMVLWLTLLVYSSASSAVFRMFACDELEDGSGYRERFLRSDYRISCDSIMHRRLQIFAGFMVAVYPAGIPLFYGFVLYRTRSLLRDPDERESNPELRSISPLWNPYKPDRFFYEVIECIRRMWLAGAVAFIYPNTAAQVAIVIIIALIFAFICEGLAPYSSALDAWVSRTGHAIVFFSMYVALLLKVDVSDERDQSQKVFAGVLVGAHSCMIAAIFVEALVLACWASVSEDPNPRAHRESSITDEMQDQDQGFLRRFRMHQLSRMISRKDREMFRTSR